MLQIFTSVNKPYDKIKPYSTSNASEHIEKEDDDDSDDLTVYDESTELKAGDTVYYWLYIVKRDHFRIRLFDYSFTIGENNNTLILLNQTDPMSPNWTHLVY